MDFIIDFCCDTFWTLCLVLFVFYFQVLTFKFKLMLFLFLMVTRLYSCNFFKVARVENLVCIPFVHMYSVSKIENWLIHNWKMKKKYLNVESSIIINWFFLKCIYFLAKKRNSFIGMHMIGLNVDNWITLVWTDVFQFLISKWILWSQF